jgi:hypothetical protein
MKDFIVIVDVGHSDKDSGQISARGIKEYDLNLKWCRPAFGWNLRGAISGNLKLSDQAARSIG